MPERLKSWLMTKQHRATGEGGGELWRLDVWQCGELAFGVMVAVELGWRSLDAEVVPYLLTMMCQHDVIEQNSGRAL